MGIQITPSILNADFAALGAEVARTPSADWIHVDVMDNHFVPNLTFGPTMVEALARSTDTPLDAHLMIADADRHALALLAAGADAVIALAPALTRKPLLGRAPGSSYGSTLHNPARATLAQPQSSHSRRDSERDVKSRLRLAYCSGE